MRIYWIKYSPSESPFKNIFSGENIIRNVCFESLLNKIFSFWESIKKIFSEVRLLYISVLSNFLKVVIWRSIKELILERNYFCAISVPSHFQKVAVWRSIEELILERNHFLRSVHQVIFRKWLFKATQKNSYWRETISLLLVSLVIFYSWSF